MSILFSINEICENLFQRGFDSFIGSFDKIDPFNFERDGIIDSTEYDANNGTYTTDLYGRKGIVDF